MGQRYWHSFLGACAVSVLIIAGCSRTGEPEIADRLQRQTWAIDNAPPAPSPPARTLDTAHGLFDVWEHRLFEHYQTRAFGPHWAGAIQAVPGGVISVNAAGEFLFFDVTTRAIERLDVGYENNRAGLLAFMWPAQNTWPHRFRFADLAAYSRGDDLRLLASTHYWHPEEECYTLRVIELDVGTLAALRAGTFRDDDWRLVFETQPCIQPDTSLQWFGHEGGGALAVDGRELYIGVGHFGLMGVDDQPIVSQDQDGMYGKTYRVNLDNGRAQRMSIGHRNQTGIVIVEGAPWAVEHGPQGGDELNIIREGKNYGWPYVTLGTQYGQETWTVGDAIVSEGRRAPPSRHFGYEEPIYSWVPSIGVNSFIRVSGFTSAWEGDFIAGGLSSRSLHRLRIIDGRVQYEEPIRIGARIRDVTQSEGGFVYVLTDENLLLELRPHVQRQQIATQEEPAYSTMPGWEQARVVLAQCGTCHSYEAGVQGALGPNLHGVVGRDVGGTTFQNYTSEWRAIGGTWTEERLDLLLREPRSIAPRNSVMSGQIPVSDAATREAIVAYLASLNNSAASQP